MMTLFILSTVEGWPDIMFTAINATGEDTGPKDNYNPGAAYFFVVFLFVGSFFFVNLVIGVMFDNFLKEKNNEQSLTAYFLSHKQ